MAAPFFPRVRSAVICDDVHQRAGEPETFDLVGVRCEIRASSFSYTHPLLCLYLQVTGRQGSVSAHVVARRGEDEEILRTADQDVAFSGPLDPAHIWWEMEDCTFPSAGVYYVQLFFGDRLSGEWPLILSHDTVSGNGERSS
jgi:hypothetical protein